MNIDKLKSNILDYAARLDFDSLALSEKDIITVKIDDQSFLATPIGKKLKDVTADDLIVIKKAEATGEYKTIAKAYSVREDITAVVHIYPKNCSVIADCGVNVPAVLDDMVQIVGLSAKCVKAENVESALKGRNCCFIFKDGVISTGRTLDEAYTGCLVLEKAAQVYIEVQVLGGEKKVGAIGGLLEHVIYKKKYSKIDQDSKLKDVKE